MKDKKFNFETLIGSIQQVHAELAAQASRAVNLSLTLRNWLIGAYIAEYELNGADRAQYGDTLLERLADELKQRQVSTCGRRQLYQYLLFYRVYPEIVRSVTAQLQPLIPQGVVIESEKVRSATALSKVNPQLLIRQLSYTHIEQLLAMDDDTKRSFYEMECIRGGWSVRELKRQIGSLYYERTGLSLKKGKLAELTQAAAEKSEPALAIRDPYVFEFLGLKPAEVMSESHLEDRLIDRLEEFLLELGHGFCFEARQKRILFGDEYGFIDLVFYHRILKCHVLVDLKLEAFSHENIGQLNTYVSWYRKNMMTHGDNPPVGILLCTEKNHVLAEYALAGMDNSLFVSKYQLELPDKESMQRFMEEELASFSPPDNGRVRQ
jgi:predicted nuclease of restriction endonuclease-like (RecB) superfamily